MFEINPSRKITKSENVKSDNNTIQQRAFLDEPQDKLDLSYKKKKNNVSFGAAIKEAIKTFRTFKEDAVSPKAVKMLKENNIVDDDFEPEWSIHSNSYENLTDLPVVFQRKLAIDMYKGKPNSEEAVYNGGYMADALISYNDEGKPSEIKYYAANVLKRSETLEYAHKQDGSPVLVKQKIYNHNYKKEKILDEEITFYKHHNGAVTISTTDGRKMSYSLRKETIRNYDNTPKPVQLPTQQQTQTINQPLSETEAPKKIFIKPNPIYPAREYNNEQKSLINNKFDKLSSEFNKANNPNDEYAFMFSKPVLGDLEKIRNLVLDVKDPKIQDIILSLLPQVKDNDIPTEFVGSYKHLNIYNDYSNLIKIYTLAKISAMTDENMAKLNNNEFSSNLDDKLIYTYNSKESFESGDIYSANEAIQTIMFDNTLNKSERYANAEGVVHKMRFERMSNTLSDIAVKFPELKGYLSENYIKPNIPQEYQEDFNNIEKATGEIIYPQDYSNFKYESLENFHNMPDAAKKHYLQHPEMCKHIYLNTGSHFMTETPYDALANLSPEEWDTFEKRNIADILDIVTGYNITTFKEKTGRNIHTVLKMSENDWKKLNDFDLLNLGKKGNELSFEKHRYLKFDFNEMQNILDNLSYSDWDTAKARGLVDMKSSNVTEYNNYGHNIGVPILIAAAKVPESTFRFLKKIEFFKNNEVNLKTNSEEVFANVAEGIEFLSKSHSDVYDNVTTLINNGFSPEAAIELVGIGAKNYNRFGKYLTAKTLELKNKGLNETEVTKILPMYVDLQAIKNKSDINELSIEEKRALLKNVIKYNSQLFDKKYANLLESPIVPKNKDEYCSLLPKLIKSIGIDVRPVDRETIDNFEAATSAMADKNSEFLNTHFTKDNFKLKLEYPRRKFINDIQEKTSGLSDTEKMKVYDYFGFDLKTDRNNIVQMHGYPINVNNGAKLSAIQEERTREVVEEVRPLVEKFSHNNKVTIDGKPELTKQINDILELFPEIRSIIGKKQHGAHDFTVDVHTLKVLQGIMSDERYAQLSDKDKKLLNIAALLHDLTKAENAVDKTHAPYSAYDSYHLLAKMNMNENDKLKIYQIIKNHEWLADYNGKVKVGTREDRDKTPQEKDKIAKDIAFELKDDNNFELANILTKADMKAVKENDDFFNKFQSAFYEATAKINPLIDNIRQTAIHLPQTKIPKASELKVDGENVQEHIYRDKDGKEYKYKRLDLKPDMDLGSLGFEKGLNSNDLNVIVHALEEDTQSATFQALGSVDSDSLLSSSYVNYAKGNYHVFRQQGFILEVDSSDIQAGTYKDFGSGYGKDLETLKGEYLFNGRRKSIRNFMSDNIKQRLKLTDKEYQNLYPEIANKSITELDETHPQAAKAMREMFMDMEIHKRRYGRDYNEWLISRPKIQAVFIQSPKYKYENPPEFLIKYAAENDLPVIYFGE